MAAKIMSGFPVRRCSWSYKPIVPVALTRRMIRWLDSVCLKQATFKREFDDSERESKGRGAANGT
jgi:hypothetical protein